MIPYGRQSISDSDIEAVVTVLKSDWLTQGPEVERFESEFAAYCKANFAVSVNSATSALHLACLAAGLGPGDWLWTSPNTFVASANCALYCRARVDFVDIDPATFNMSIAALENKLLQAEKVGKLPKIVLPVHFAGQPCDMERIEALSKQYGFTVIEDGAHAIGAEYHHTSIGSCDYSSMTVFSFHPVKIITTGEGGMITTNDKSIYDRLVRLRSHGITRNPEMLHEPNNGPWYYQQIELGYNYRMTDFQAALGSSQLTRLKQFVTRRHELAKRYNKSLHKLPISIPWQHPEAYSSFHLYVIQLHLEKIKKTRKEVIEELRDKEIFAHVHYIPVHIQPYYRNLGFSSGDFPVAEEYYNRAISLPLYQDLSNDQQDYIIRTLDEVLS